MRRIKALVTVLFCTLLLQTVLGQEQFALTGNGARAAGMGYAFTGVADDATAISWNSAGLTQLYSMEASIVGQLGFGSISTDYTNFDIEGSLSSSINLNFASFVVPFTAGDMSIVGGIAYRTLYNFNKDLEWTAKIVGDTEEFTRKDDDSGAVTSISPALAVQINNMLSVGAVFNIIGGSWENKFKDYDDSESEASSDFSGTSVDIGVLVKASPQVSIGGNFYMPYTLTETVKSEGSGDDTVYDLKVPFFWAAGILFRATDNLSLALDYRSRPWSSSEYSEDGENDEDWALQDANSIHIGLEYLIQSGKAVIPVRLGFYTLPTPATEFNYVIGEDGGQITYNAITGGLGLVMGSFIIDGSIEYLFGSYIGDIDSRNGSDYNVEYKLSDFRVTVGATIHLGG
jgi:long-subunit fatty acid transport protein